MVAGNIIVGIGAHNLTIPHEEIRSRKIEIHPLFDVAYLEHDIALIMLEKPAKLSKNIGIICLPNDETPVKPGTEAVVAGWGVYTKANIKEYFLDIWADLNDPLELAEKLDAYDSLRPVMKNNSNQTFKKKGEFRKPFPIKKSQPVGGYHDNHSLGPSRTVPRFPSSRTEGRKPIDCYGCGTPGVVKSKCPTCTRTNEIETEVNCMTLFNLNSDLYPSSVIVLKHFGEKIAVCADTGASHTIAGEKLFKFLQEHGITFTNKVISFMMADGIRQTITALRTVVDLYIEGKVIPTEFLVLPEAKGNKTLGKSSLTWAGFSTAKFSFLAEDRSPSRILERNR
ncbi:uncharacterized protein TNCT_655681, partial [Trichonephila clavata]